ncbi:MAG: hypothetical protein DELT_03288 [Desulfovibrio sp.]
MLLDDRERLAVKEVFHDFRQLLVRELLDAGHPLGKDFTVAPVGTKGKVVHTKLKRLADISRFLADAKMGRTRMVVFNAFILSGRFDGVEHRLEFADNPHIPVNVQEFLFRKVFHFILYRFLVGVHRDIFECDLARCPHFLRINRQTLCHCFSPLYIDNNYLTVLFIRQYQSCQMASRIISLTVGCGNTIFLIASMFISLSTSASAPQMISDE